MNDKTKASSQPQEMNVAINQLERTMQASIALMKRLRRERRRFSSIQNRSHGSAEAAAH